MNIDSEFAEKLRRVGAIALRLALIFVAAFLAYAVLYPVIILICFKFGWIDPFASSPILDKAGIPLEWLSDKFPPYETFLEFLLEHVFKLEF